MTGALQFVLDPYSSQTEQQQREQFEVENTTPEDRAAMVQAQQSSGNIPASAQRFVLDTLSPESEQAQRSNFEQQTKSPFERLNMMMDQTYNLMSINAKQRATDLSNTAKEVAMNQPEIRTGKRIWDFLSGVDTSGLARAAQTAIGFSPLQTIIGGIKNIPAIARAHTSEKVDPFDYADITYNLTNPLGQAYLRSQPIYNPNDTPVSGRVTMEKGLPGLSVGVKQAMNVPEAMKDVGVIAAEVAPLVTAAAPLIGGAVAMGPGPAIAAAKQLAPWVMSSIGYTTLRQAIRDSGTDVVVPPSNPAVPPVINIPQIPPVTPANITITTSPRTPSPAPATPPPAEKSNVPDFNTWKDLFQTAVTGLVSGLARGFGASLISPTLVVQPGVSSKAKEQFGGGSSAPLRATAAAKLKKKKKRKFAPPNSGESESEL